MSVDVSTIAILGRRVDSAVAAAGCSDYCIPALECSVQKCI